MRFDGERRQLVSPASSGSGLCSLGLLRLPFAGVGLACAWLALRCSLEQDCSCVAL